MKLENAAFDYGDLIFVAKINTVGAPKSLAPSQPGVSSYSLNVTVNRNLVGDLPPNMKGTTFTYNLKRPSYEGGDLDETAPVVGESYIFFASELKGDFTALKMLIATESNIATVEKLLTPSFGANVHGHWTKLCGSRLTVGNAIKQADAAFVGTLTSPGSEVILPPDAPYAGPLLRRVGVEVSKILFGSIDKKVQLSMFVVTVAHEEMPKVGTSYIFFVQTKHESDNSYPYNCLEKADTSLIAIKLMSAADGNVAAVESASHEK